MTFDSGLSMVDMGTCGTASTMQPCPHSALPHPQLLHQGTVRRSFGRMLEEARDVVWPQVLGSERYFATSKSLLVQHPHSQHITRTFVYICIHILWGLIERSLTWADHWGSHQKKRRLPPRNWNKYRVHGQLGAERNMDQASYLGWN